MARISPQPVLLALLVPPQVWLPAKARKAHHRQPPKAPPRARGKPMAASRKATTTPAFRRSIVATYRSCRWPGSTTPANRAGLRPTPSSWATCCTPPRRATRSLRWTAPPASCCGSGRHPSRASPATAVSPTGRMARPPANAASWSAGATSCLHWMRRQAHQSRASVRTARSICGRDCAATTTKRSPSA